MITESSFYKQGYADAEAGKPAKYNPAELRFASAAVEQYLKGYSDYWEEEG